MEKKHEFEKRMMQAKIDYLEQKCKLLELRNEELTEQAENLKPKPKTKEEEKPKGKAKVEEEVVEEEEYEEEEEDYEEEDEEFDNPMDSDCEDDYCYADVNPPGKPMANFKEAVAFIQKRVKSN
jgi:chromosome segregation ATPase